MSQIELDKTLNVLPSDLKGGTIHLLGIGGVAMASLAGLLVSQGLRVTGSDENIYSPMKELVEDLLVPVSKGYGPESLGENISLVVVGNVVTRKFPVVQTLLDRAINYLSFPQAMEQLFLAQTNNLVVAGCHGKSSITDLCAHIFTQGGLDPGFLIGGASLNFQRPFRKGGGEVFIIEGDEYDSAFFLKVPKFVFYRPSVVILTSVEFDHADIYPDLESVVSAYESLILLLPPDGLLLANGMDPLVRKVARLAKCPVLYYGETGDCDWRMSDFRTMGFSSSFSIEGPQGFSLELTWKRMGRYNALGALAAVAAYKYFGGSTRELKGSFLSFTGVKRRQEIIYDQDGVTLIDDFAHHPTAVLKTLMAIREAFPARRLIVAFEPRSNTTRRAIFQKEYAISFQSADRVYLAQVNQPQKAPEGDRLDLERLKIDIGQEKARIYPEASQIAEDILEDLRPGDLIVVMSNGDFGKLVSILLNGLQSRDKAHNYGV
ncbi:MAG: Mur ligase domain-containing protein [Deltaproteobacteria bacterium]|jgi:UDP-N-acetylmuramate: L-alanyl-gamma-D-glutamyl-meso-diaminopimelate ligase|nr:Mur ligase domain-containing protein [Deltaproteobacteria bacterium]